MVSPRPWFQTSSNHLRIRSAFLAISVATPKCLNNASSVPAEDPRLPPGAHRRPDSLQLKDDLGDAQRHNPANPGNREASVIFGLQPRSGSVVAQNAEGHKSKRDDIRADHPLLMQSHQSLAYRVVRHARR